MSDHEHAYLICENKCLVEGLPKSDLYTKTEINTKLGGVVKLPTYVELTTSNPYEANLGLGESIAAHADGNNRYLKLMKVGAYLTLHANGFTWYNVSTEGQTSVAIPYNTITWIIRVA